MQYTYEAHIINNKLMPFLYHIDRVTNVTEGIPNYHTNIELLFCIEGQGEAICGAQRYAFKPGDIVVINSNVLHSVKSDTYVRYYCLIVDDEFCLSNGIDCSKLRFDTHIKNEEVKNAYNKVCRAFASRDKTKITSVRYAVLGLILLLVQSYSETVEQSVYKNDIITAKRIKNVVEYIQSNMNTAITLDGIAEYVGISKFHLSRDFKRFTGNTIFEYINMTRCRTAASLIAGGMSVSSAANECGFENLSYFSRTFKKYIGRLPSDTT